MAGRVERHSEQLTFRAFGEERHSEQLAGASKPRPGGRAPSAVAVTHCRAGSARHEPAAAPAARADGGGQQGRRVSGQGTVRKWEAGRCPAA